MAASGEGAARRILTINTGSSSLKAALYPGVGVDRPELAVVAERVGLPDARLRVVDADGRPLADEEIERGDHRAAVGALLAWLRRAGLDDGVAVIGHRVVHGGEAYAAPAAITAEMVAALRRLVPIDPAHLPQALAAIEAAGDAFPGVPQVACFDTAFHRGMPRVARLFALPRELAEAGVVRYGFHGLSYESILDQLRGPGIGGAGGRLVVAHLGSGASMAAVRDGRGVETTMGFTPTGGLVMGTRAGDLDPGVLLYLLRERGLDAAALDELVNRRAGLLGVSGVSADMRDLLAREAADPAAADAVALFCHQAKKFLGALAATLGGLDTLVFTGGVGEHAAPVRERVCAGLEFLGVRLDPARNRAHAPIVSRDGGPVTVRVMRSDEDLVIARHAGRLLRRRPEGGVGVPL